MRHKLTTDVYKGLVELSKTLPKMIRTDKNGNPIYRVATEYTGGKQYKKFKEPVLVNHEVKLIDIYKNTGDKGIQMYVSQLKQIEKQNETLPTTDGKAA